MVYRFRQKPNRYVRVLRRIRTTWHPAILTGVFVLGASVGLLAAVQDQNIFADLARKVKGGSHMAQTDDTTPKQSNGATSARFAGKTKGAASGTAGGSGVAKEVRVATTCGTIGPKRAGLTSASMSQLKKLAEYETVCDGAVASRVSFFVGTPRNPAEAKEHAIWVSDTLKEISKNGLAPIVFMEPVTPDEKVVNFTDYKNGAYDLALDAYFAELKARGVTDAMMGTWVPFPESNIPVWNNVNPADVAANITKTVQIQKKHFPGSKAAMLLQTMTYPDGTWGSGKYTSLLPYAQGIPKGLIDSFGMQGFAWPPTDPNDSAQLDPKVFLRTDFAREIATALGAKEVWFNTGTFAKSLVVSKTKPYTLTPQQRQAVLDGILAQAKVLKGQGFSVGIHMFNEDKSDTAEGIDWSYWPKGQVGAGQHTPVFKTFASDAAAAGIPLWIFDSN